MTLFLKRLYFKPAYTIGKLYLDNEYICDTLEDTYRKIVKLQDKIPHQTAVPNGTYKVIYSYSPTFEKILPELLDVPFFKGIRIHCGNDDSDSSGCVLVGENKRKGQLVNSKKNFKKLLSKLGNCQNVTIKIFTA